MDKEMPVDEMKIFFHQTLVYDQILSIATVTKRWQRHERFFEYFAEIELKEVGNNK
jgi:hypothetical protein